MPPNILIAIDPLQLPVSGLERIRSLVPDGRLTITDRKENIEPLLGEVEVAAGHLPPEMLARMPNLRWYQQWGAGADWLLKHPELAARDFILTNASGVHAIPISEHILAYMLAFARCLPQAIRAQEQHRWERDSDSLPVFELAGKTLLLVGVGAIGRRTAQVAKALGMRVLGVRHDAGKSAPGIERMVPTRELLSVLPEADFVALTIPLTKETRGLFGADAFAQMKPTAYFINIGRGGTVDEPALVHALQAGQIAGAGLDVFATEPLPPDSPLWDMQNVIITAHYSGGTPQYHERAMGIFIENLERYLKGEKLKNVVDKKRGY